MGYYDKRTAELLLTFNKQVTDGREIAWYLPRLTEYTKKCDALLAALVAEVSNFNVNDSREAQQWASVRDKKLAEVVQARPDVGKFNGVPSTALLAFHTSFQLQEAAFISGLKATNAGDEADRIAAIAKHLQEKTANLDKIWKETLDRDGDFEKKAEETARDIAAIIDDAIEKAAANNRTLAEAFVELVRINDGIPEGLPNLTSVLPGMLGTTVGVITKGLAASTMLAAKMMDRVIERSHTLRETFRKEANLLVVFAETRKDVEAFVKSTNLEQGKKAHEQAAAELHKLASSMKTAGQKDDLAAFGKRVMDALTKILDEAERRHDEFVSRHRSKFFGPLASDIKEQLLESSRWNGVSRSIATRALHERLEEFYSKNLLTVTAGKVRPEVREYMEREIRSDFDKAMKTILEIDRKLVAPPPEKQIEGQRKLLATRLG